MVLRPRSQLLGVHGFEAKVTTFGGFMVLRPRSQLLGGSWF